jgi:hypothetical protein
MIRAVSVKVMLIEEGGVMGPFGTVVAVPRVGDHVHWSESTGPGPEFVVTKVRFAVEEEPKEGSKMRLKAFAEVYLRRVEADAEED